jgi:hypothetical protein
MEFFAKSKEKHDVWDPMPDLTITSPMSTPESTPTHLPWATLCQSRLYLTVRPLDLFSGFFSEMFNLDVNSFSLIYQSLRFNGVNDNGDHKLGIKL